MEQQQAVDVDVQMASETCSICPMPTSSGLHLPGPAEAGHNPGRVSGGTQVWTWAIMSTDDQRKEMMTSQRAQSCCLMLLWIRVKVTYGYT